MLAKAKHPFLINQCFMLNAFVFHWSHLVLTSLLKCHTNKSSFRQISAVSVRFQYSLPPALRLLPRTISDTFYNQLKTVLFDRAGTGSTSE